MHCWRVPPPFCVVWFARAGIGGLALALVTAGCSSGTAAGGGAVGARAWRSRRRPAGRHREGHSEGRAGRHRRGRKRRSVHHDFGPVAGDRPDRTGLLPRRRRRQEGRSALQDRSAAARIGAAAVAGQRDARSGAAEPGRSAARSRRRTAEYQQLTSERQAQLVARGIVSKDAGEQSRAQADATAATVNADKAAIESARAQLAVQQSVDRKRQGAAQLHRSSDRRSTAAPATTRVKVGNLATANQELVTIAQLQPVYVTFTVPAVHLPTIKRHMGADKLPVVATPQDEDKAPAERTAHLRRQRRRHGDRHHQAEGDVPQHRPPAVAGSVRARQPAAHDAVGRDGRARARPSRPARTGSSSSSSSRIPRWISGP